MDDYNNQTAPSGGEYRQADHQPQIFVNEQGSATGPVALPHLGGTVVIENGQQQQEPFSGAIFSPQAE